MNRANYFQYKVMFFIHMTDKESNRKRLTLHEHMRSLNEFSQVSRSSSFASLYATSFLFVFVVYIVSNDAGVSR